MTKSKNPYHHDATTDIQHDLALMWADLEDSPHTEMMVAELRRRKAPLPQHCRWEYITANHRTLRYET